VRVGIKRGRDFDEARFKDVVLGRRPVHVGYCVLQVYFVMEYSIGIMRVYAGVNEVITNEYGS